MISLPAIEAVLNAHYAVEADGGPVLAVVADGALRPEIVLFATRQVDRDSANRLLLDAGLSSLHTVRRVVRVDALPLLGTGKTNHRALTEQLTQMPPQE
jgi:long-chain-fatty-acid--[acyl-carrier-protein] ligase